MKVSKLLVGTTAIVSSSIFHIQKKISNGDHNVGLPTVCANEGSLNLEQVQVIFRHGARTTFVDSNVSDQLSNLGQVVWDKEKWMKVLPWTDINYMTQLQDGGEAPEPYLSNPKELRGGCITGQLTTVGQQNSYDLGRWLANEYTVKHDYLSSTFKEDEVFVRSTNRPRTIQSAVCLLAGLFQMGNIPQPIAINVKPYILDDMLPNFDGCSKLQELRIRVKSMQMVDLDALEMNKMLGMQNGALPLRMLEIYDIIDCRSAHGLYLPPELLEKFDVVLEGAIQHWLNMEKEDLRIGSFLHTLCCNITESMEGRCKHKLFLYSAHDTTLVALLLVFGIFDGKHWPGFSSNVILEVYRKDGCHGCNERFVRVMYNGEPLVLHPNGKDEYLPVGDFLRLADPYRVLDWNTDCGNKEVLESNTS